MSKHILYHGEYVTVSDEVAAFFEEDYKRREAAVKKEKRRHLITEIYEFNDYFHFNTISAVPNQVIRNIAMQRMREAILTFPENDRKLLYMRYQQEKTMQEIGDILGITKMAVSKRLKRIEQQLYEMIKDEFNNN